jgi:Xaa-Pro aminopeptidase
MVEKSRLTNLQSQLNQNEAWLLSTASDVHYFTSFGFLVPTEREALLLITSRHAALIHATFSPINYQEELSYYEGCHIERLTAHVSQIHQTYPFSQLYIDSESLFVHEYKALKAVSGFRIRQLNRQQIWQLRAVKDAGEQAAIRRAAQISSSAFSAIRPKLRPGMTEIEVRNLLEAEMRLQGSSGVAFPTIVAFGDHSALPHHQPTDRPLEKEMPILLDFGATHNGYCADMTRTFWFGEKPSPSFQEIEQTVMAAYDQVIETINKFRQAGGVVELRGDRKEKVGGETKAGGKTRVGGQETRKELTARDLDQAARSYITKAGFGNEFVHTTGHGLGLDIHEFPSLNWKNQVLIVPGMTLTVEPGIYLEGEFGYRYENTILITESGCERLS